MRRPGKEGRKTHTMMMSFNDWICTEKVFEKTERLLKEDILDDRAFPESTSRRDMLLYLRKVNARDSFIRAFERLYRRYYRAEIRPLKEGALREDYEGQYLSDELERLRPGIERFREYKKQKNNMSYGMYRYYEKGENNDNIQTVVHEKPYYDK